MKDRADIYELNLPKTDIYLLLRRKSDHIYKQKCVSRINIMLFSVEPLTQANMEHSPLIH